MVRCEFKRKIRTYKIALVSFGNEENYGLLFVGGELLLFNQDIKYFDVENDNIVTKIVK